MSDSSPEAHYTISRASERSTADRQVGGEIWAATRCVIERYGEAICAGERQQVVVENVPFPEQLAEANLQAGRGGYCIVPTENQRIFAVIRA